METRNYGFITGLFILLVYFITYFIKGDSDSIIPVMSSLGIVLFASLLALLFFSLFFKRKNKFKKITFALSIIFLSLVGEGIFVMLAFLFRAGFVLAFFSSSLDKSALVFPLAYLVIFIFNKAVFKYDKIIRVNAIIGAVFLFAGLFIPGTVGFILLSLCGLLFSSVLYRVFYYHIPRELNLN